MLVGNDNRILIPVSFSLGATFLVIVDDFGRILTGSEITPGNTHCHFGGPFFVYLLKKTKGVAGNGAIAGGTGGKLQVSPGTYLLTG